MTTEIRRYRVTLTTKEPFRIGALQDVLSSSDNPVARIGGRIIVQGSSLKGALRAELERHLIAKYPNDVAMKPCIPSPFNTLSEDERALIKKGLYRGDLVNREAGCMYSNRGKSQGICPVCYLLGAQGLVGFVRVPFLFADSQLDELYSVRIDRSTGVVAEKTNRQYQVIRDGTEFLGELEILIHDPARDWKLGKPRSIGIETKEFLGDQWLQNNKQTIDQFIGEYVTDRLTSITLLGGYKSKGCGGVKIAVQQINQASN